MRLLFVDPSSLSYTVETPKKDPLGGSQSALCYLLSTLHEKGQEVFLANNCQKIAVVDGILHLPLSALSKATLTFIQPDVCIVLNSTSSIQDLRTVLPTSTSLVLWTQHHVDQPGVQDLSDPVVVSLIDRIVVVSEWQRQQYLTKFKLEPDLLVVLRNAVSPYFEHLFSPEESILEQKLPNIRLAYTSTPFRGLEQLLEIYPRLYQRYPNLELQVYSSMNVYQVSPAEDRWQALYEKFKNLPGVNYHGSCSQRTLAEALKKIAILSYPNTFPETSCISALEAMASGCFIVTSTLGALPETTAGFAELVEFTTDWPTYQARYGQALARIVERFYCPENHIKLESHLRSQVEYIHDHYTWQRRADEWINCLESLINSQPVILTAESWKSRLEFHLKSGHYQLVIDTCIQLIEKFPEDSVWFAYQGAAYILQGKETEAQLLWSLCMTEYPEEQYLNASHNWSKILINLANYEKFSLENRFAFASYAYEFQATLETSATLLDLFIKLSLPPDDIKSLISSLNSVRFENSEITEDDKIFVLEILRKLLVDYEIDEETNKLIENWAEQLNLQKEMSHLLFELILNNPEKIAKSIAKTYMKISVVDFAAYHFLASALIRSKSPELALVCVNSLLEDSLNLTPIGKDLALTRKIEVLQTYKYNIKLLQEIDYLCRQWLDNIDNFNSYYEHLNSENITLPTLFYTVSSYFALTHHIDQPDFLKPIFNHRNQLAQEKVPLFYQLDKYQRIKKSSLYNISKLEKIKVGFIGVCFKTHPAGNQIRSFIRMRNRDTLTLYAYSIEYRKESSDSMREWFKASFDYFRPLTEPDPEKIATIIHDDDLDVLIDLDSCTIDMSWMALHLKPAPVQATWVGFDASGIPTVDYFIVDPYILPEGAQAWYTETLWRLPACYLSLDGYEVANKTGIRDQLGLSADTVIFLCAQRASKIQPEMLKLQFAIVEAVPNAVLIIKYHASSSVFEEWCRSVAEAYGFDLNKLYFLTPNPSEIHRANLYDVDVVLDTYPYAGGAMSLEALWLEVPIVTKVGQQFVARHTYTFLKNVGVEEGIAFNDEEYVNWGIRFGTEPELRQRVSWKLRQAKRHAPLWNPQRFSREMEKALAAMVNRYRTGEMVVPPRHRVGE
ncbi:glycosyltransferase [Thermosynechococcus sp. HN-54]|uniref:O-linked N-acetylglucosamine transferase family protein n=1 Tax=Thermosynechococcus sp. HN-54 TaxID=2933959 RepID=UPI00202CFE3B|nr:glycosyltransferase [Thermosynechococcus sp. HN-54]URR35592.1 glycosyltransferase [Thermosynechococcus sp. HN-54]